MMFGEKDKKLTTTEETLIVSQKISSNIDRLHKSMENLATSIDAQTNRVEVGKYLILILQFFCTRSLLAKLCTS